MAETIDAYYRRYGRDATPAGNADPEAVQQLLATSLDSSLFRKELAHLADLCDDAGSESNRLRRFEADARPWIAHLERDVAGLKAEVERVWQERNQLARELEELRALQEIADRLPAPMRRAIAKLVRRARS